MNKKSVINIGILLILIIIIIIFSLYSISSKGNIGEYQFLEEGIQISPESACNFTVMEETVKPVQENITLPEENISLPDENTIIPENIILLKENVTLPEEVIQPEENVTISENIDLLEETVLENLTEMLTDIKDELGSKSYKTNLKLKNLIKEDGKFTLETESDTGKERLVIRGLGNVSDVEDLQMIALPDKKISKGKITTPVVSADVSALENATITLTKEGDVNAIVKCENWDFVTSRCGGWVETEIPFMDDGETITFTVTEFSSYAGAEISIINVQSYPVVGGEWWVRFTTVGTANLTIQAVDGTEWDNEAEDKDLKFLEVRCGETVLNYEWSNGSVFIPNYSCDEIGYETSKVLTSGKHTLEFVFGDDVEYAYNQATYTLFPNNTASISPCPTNFGLMSIGTVTGDVVVREPGETDATTVGPGNTDCSVWNATGNNIGNTTASAEIWTPTINARNSASIGSGWLWNQNLTGETIQAGSTLDFNLDILGCQDAATTESQRYVARASIITCSGGAATLKQDLFEQRLTNNASAGSLGQDGWRDSDVRFAHPALNTISNTGLFSIPVKTSYTFVEGDMLLIELGFGDADSTTDRTPCLRYNNPLTNITVTTAVLDTTAPIINLELPEDNATNTTTNIIDFTYNVSDSSSLANCTLLINDAINVTDTAMQKDTAGQNLTKYLFNGEYNWSVNCTDQYNNIGNSETRNISVSNYVWLNVNMSLPINNTEVNQGEEFTINATVTCSGESGAECGTVYALARYGDTSADTAINTTQEASPFFIVGDAYANFTEEHIISTSADNTYSVYAIDVDRDNDIDVLSASYLDNKIAWYKNNGSESFTAYNISTSASGAYYVYAIDVDGDNDIDVLSASSLDDKIAWYENNGSESFTERVISTIADFAASVYAIDVDSDNDIDVLSASSNDNKIAWYENNGSESFTAHVISTDAVYAASVYAIDVDGDNDTDVLSASSDDNKIAWYENNGSESFTAHNISTSASGAGSVYAIDVDGDNDIDVLSASYTDNKIAWYENNDSMQNFTEHVISTSASGAGSVYAIDVDGDNDIDVLSASDNDNKIAWYENDGSESFTAHVISTDAVYATSVYAIDVDGDNDIDALSASYGDDKIAWYENTMITSALNPKTSPTTLNQGGSWDVSWSLNVTSTITESYLLDVFFNSSYGNSLVPDNDTYDVTIILNPNDPPSNPSVTLSPLDQSDSQDLTCTATVNDSDISDTLTASIEWYKDNVSNYSVSGLPVTNNIDFTYVLTANGNLTGGDEWGCGVSIDDGLANSSWANATQFTVISITNLAPSDPTLTLNFTYDNSNYTNESMWCQIYINDPDAEADMSVDMIIMNTTTGNIGDAVAQYSITSAFTGLTEPTYVQWQLDQYNFTKNDYVWCQARVYDQELYSNWVNSSSLKVENYPVQISDPLGNWSNVDEDGSAFSLDWSSNFTDPDNTEGKEAFINWTYELNDTTILSLSVNNDTDHVTITPLANASGTVEINWTVTDTGGATYNETVYWTINPINDAPWWNETSNTTYSYNEDFGFDYTVWDEDGLNNTFWDVEDNHLPYNCTASTNDISIITNVRYNGSIIADSVASGQAILTVNCSDSGWLSAVTNFEITINAAPIVTIQSPQNVTYNYSIIDLNVSADEPIDTWYYSLNEGGNITFSPNSMIFAKGGSNYLVVYANDTSGNINSSEVYFTVDLVEISVSESPIIDTDKTQYWESGSFDGTQLNNSYEDMILLPGYSSGNFTSAVFDAGSTVVWNNISWVEILPTPQNTITMNPTHAEDEFGVDITSYVNVSDGINTWGRVEVQTWTDTVPVDATIDSVVGYCEVEFIDAGAKIGFQTSRNNGTSWDSEVCVQDAVASTTFECDLKANSSVDTADEVNNLRLRCTFPLSNESKYYSTDWVHVVTQYESSVAFSTDLKLQVRSDDDNSDWSPWLGPDGTGTAYYTNADGENLNVSNNRYFQYKVEFETDNIIYSPELHNVAIAYTSTMIDSIPPDVTLNLPEDNATLSSVPVTFNCSATDNVQLKSITLYGNWTNQLFYDDFSSYAEGSDGSENWDFENYGGNQTVEGGEYHFHGNTAEEPISIRKNFNYNDYAVESMVKTTTLTGHAYICPRYDTVRDKYEIAIDMRYSTVSLSVVVNDVWAQLNNTALGWTIQNNTWYSLKAKITTEGNTNRFLIYVNDTLYINQTDSNLMNNTKLALLTYSPTDSYDIYFDNVTVSGEYWFANETKTITGTDNSTTFSQSISDGAYSWNCYACDNSSNCAFAATNRTFSIGIDSTPPTVNLELPENNTVNTTSNTIDFTYNVSDLSSVPNCSLIIDGSVNTTSTSITKDVTQNLTTYLDNGEYNWLVNCTDQYNNIGNSETRNISINVAQDTTPPTIYLELPTDNATNTTTNTIDFTYNVSDVSNLDNCTLIIENSGGDISINVTDTAMLKDTAGQNLTTYLTYDDYEWSVNCTDEYNNIAGSEMRNVSVFITVGRPTELSITLDTVDNKTVILNWTNATNVEYFNVYITDNYIDGFSSTPNFTGITELGFIDGNAPAFKKLFYKVSAVNGPAEEFIITSVGKIETYQLEPGFHLLSLPLNISNYELNDGTNNGYKFTEDQPDCISSLFMYDGTNFLQTINEGGQVWVPATGSETFTTLNTSAHGYWFEIAKNCNITFAGLVPNENLTVALDYEWQVVGWYSPYELPLGQESVYGNPISVNPSGSVRHLYRYNSTSSSGANWDMMTYFDGYGWWPAYQDRLDFTHLQPNSGYYFHSTPSATWTHDPTLKPT